MIRYIAFGHNDCASEKYTNDSYVRRQNAALKSDGFGIFLAVSSDSSSIGIDSFGIGWIAADSSSHQLATKTASAVGEVSYCYASTGNSAGLSSSVDMDTSQSGGVVGTPVIINHQNTSTYGKHISGTVGVGTQSNSSNMETIQIFVAYAHSTV